MVPNLHERFTGIFRLPIVAVMKLTRALDRLVSVQRSRGQIVLALAVAAAILVVLFAFTGLADWTDDHSTTIQGLAVIALAATTAMYMLYTRELVVRTREQRGPYVFFEINTRGGLLDSCIRNSGERGAEDIRIDIEQDVLIFGDDDKRGFLGWPMFQEPIAFLPPGRSVSQIITNLQTAGPRLRNIPPEKRVIRYKISYKDGTDEYNHAYIYDLSHLLPVGGDPFPFAGNYLAQLTRQVETLTTVVGRDLDGIKESLLSVREAILRQDRT
jgi:hypothetical protein